MSDPQAVFGDDGNATQTGNATCYSFNPDTGEYVGRFDFWTLIGSGIPGSSTLIAPPTTGEKEVPVFSNGQWSVLADHRGETVYSTKDKAVSVVNDLGDYPADTTPIAPATNYDAWNGQKWVTDTDASHKGAVAQADSKKAILLSEANAYTGPWQTQLLLGIITDTDKASLTTWMTYYQQVQQVDTSKAPDIDWPQKP